MSFANACWMSRAFRGLFAPAVTLALLLPAAAPAGEVRFSGEGHAQNPVWSLDGKWVAFEVNRFAGNVDLYVSEVTGDIAKDAKQVRLAGASNAFGGSTQVVINPVWHPSRIMVFEGSNQGGVYRLYYAQPGGSPATEMLVASKAPGNLAFPAISPDGNTLAYVSDQSGNGDIRAWNRTTDQFQQLTATPGSEMFPMYDRSGSRLLFTRKRNDAEAIYVLDTSTGNEKLLVSENGDQTRPVFVADGERVAYFSNERGQGLWDLVVIDAGGGGKRVLARDVRLPHRARPAVSTDGQWLAYVFDDPAKGDAVMLARVDGSKTVTIPTPHKACGEPALTVQGGRVLLAYTALPAEKSDWRSLHVVDVTGKL